jgi:Cysteine-rich domain
VRALQRAHGARACPERQAAEIATRHLQRHDRIDNLTFGVAMATKGHVPKDVLGAAGALGTIVTERLRGFARREGSAAPGAAAAPATATGAETDVRPETAAPQPFYGGCSLPQDAEAHRLTLAVAASLGVPLAEETTAGCCGHPSRGQVAAKYASKGAVLTACPACDASLRETQIETTPLWEVLAAHARRDERALVAAAPSFVPYVGCLGERDRALASLADAAALAGATAHQSFPSLHGGCCGALGGMYRGETATTRRLLDFAAQRQAPIVTTCLLCRDNLRSAARRRRQPVDIHFWPEFFTAAPRNGARAQANETAKGEAR